MCDLCHVELEAAYPAHFDNFLEFNSGKLQKFVKAHWPNSMEKKMSTAQLLFYQHVVTPCKIIDLDDMGPKANKQAMAKLRHHFFTGTLSEVAFSALRTFENHVWSSLLLRLEHGVRTHSFMTIQDAGRCENN